jgi:hypothetical protein
MNMLFYCMPCVSLQVYKAEGKFDNLRVLNREVISHRVIGNPLISVPAVWGRIQALWYLRWTIYHYLTFARSPSERYCFLTTIANHR